MNLLSYVDKYGNFSFDEVEFNEIDNAIFASLSYIGLHGIVSSDNNKKVTISEAGELYFKINPYKVKYVLAVRQAIKLLRYIKDTKRYGGLYLYNYVYEVSEEQQFSAVTIEINPKLLYVSFEGTDHLVSGWKEDFMMTYMFPVPSQKKAIDYVNKNFLLTNKKIILGGHSKGGNLALVAGMYANIFIRNKIIKIYNNDGPGLLKEYFESREYAKVKNKLIFIIPNYSFVGILLYHSSDYIVVRSVKKGANAHDLHTWVVNDKSFMRAELDKYNKVLESEIINWLKKYTREERKRFVFSMFDILKRAKIDSFLDITNDKKLILDLVNESKELSEIDREMLLDFLSMLFNCFKDVKLEGIKKFFDKK